MDSIVKKCSRKFVSLILALTLAVVFYVLPLNGEMCSTITSAVDGDNLPTLQKRAFSSFRSTCRKEPPLQSTTLKGTSLCTQNTHRVNSDTKIELQLPMTSPVRLEFTGMSSNDVWVFFSPNSPGIGEALHAVHLFTDKAYILKPLPSSADWLTVQIKDGLNYIGVPVIITYDNGRFEVAIQGVQESTLTYDVTSLPQPTSWYVSFFAATGVEFGFTEPCINDFNPQFNLYYR